MSRRPLSDKLRPTTLDQVVGQDHLLKEGGLIHRSIQKGQPLSLILYGPPGCGKTSIARLYAQAFAMKFYTMSAIFSGVAELKKIVKELQENPLLCSRGAVLFVDEIHRFNKMQQDAFLPFLEDGTFLLVGATAENPSFYLNNALLSRVRVLPLNTLSDQHLKILLQRCEEKVGQLPLDEQSRQQLIEHAAGDGRYLLNLIDNILTTPTGTQPNKEELAILIQRRAPLADRSGEEHYNLISALHKSVRGSDPDAALYWFARMLEGGEEPLFIARRLIRIACEDVGLADPNALGIAVAARESYEMLGSPEGELALAEALVYLALAPKSNALYTAYGRARDLARKTAHLPPPKEILNAPTKMMRDLGYAKGYIYDHDTEKGFSGQHYFPEPEKRPNFYRPVERGFEREMGKRMRYFAELRVAINSNRSSEGGESEQK